MDELKLLTLMQQITRFQCNSRISSQRCSNLFKGVTVVIHRYVATFKKHLMITGIP